MSNIYQVNMVIYKNINEYWYDKFNLEYFWDSKSDGEFSVSRHLLNKTSLTRNHRMRKSCRICGIYFPSLVKQWINKWLLRCSLCCLNIVFIFHNDNVWRWRVLAADLCWSCEYKITHQCRRTDEPFSKCRDSLVFVRVKRLYYFWKDC